MKYDVASQLMFATKLLKLMVTGSAWEYQCYWVPPNETFDLKLSCVLNCDVRMRLCTSSMLWVIKRKKNAKQQAGRDGDDKKLSGRDIKEKANGISRG